MTAVGCERLTLQVQGTGVACGVILGMPAGTGSAEQGSLVRGEQMDSGRWRVMSFLTRSVKEFLGCPMPSLRCPGWVGLLPELVGCSARAGEGAGSCMAAELKGDWTLGGGSSTSSRPELPAPAGGRRVKAGRNEVAG